MKYPDVDDEFATIARVTEGLSLARYGDGELKCALGAGIRHQDPDPKLAAELLRIVRTPHAQCVVGIPTMDPRGPKYPNWSRHELRFMTILSPSVWYGSAFVSRPDSAPWIATREYAESVQSLWADKRVVVVCERKGSMHRAVRMAARSAVHVECRAYGAYAQIDRLEKRVIEHQPDIAVLSAGPTATCLADRLARRGIQAIDLGSAGAFLLRMLK